MFKILTLRNGHLEKEGCENMFVSFLSLMRVALQTMSDEVGEEDEFKTMRHVVVVVHMILNHQILTSSQLQVPPCIMPRKPNISGFKGIIKELESIMHV